MSSRNNSSMSAFPQLPDYILLDVLLELPGRDLIVSSRVCKHWHTLIHTRRRLREHAFLPPTQDTDEDLPAKAVYMPDEGELHPIFNSIHFSAAQKPEYTTYGRRPKAPSGLGRELRDAGAGVLNTHMATSPPMKELKLELLKYHAHMTVRNAAGVRVGDVMQALPKYITEITDFTFEDFYARDICVAKGFDLHKRMRRNDMIGHEKVLITFSPAADPQDLNLFRAQHFVSVSAAIKAAQTPGVVPIGYRFWGAFAHKAALTIDK